MLFLGSIIKFLLGLFVGKALNNPAILGQLGGLLSGGGLGKILEQLQRAGLGNAVDSWISKNKNKPVSADQLSDAIGDDQMTEMARDAGMSKDQFADQLARELPGMVDKL